MWKASAGATSDSPLSTRRRLAIWEAGQSERLARVRLTILPSKRDDSRRRMAGGELRLGTDSTYMGNTYHNLRMYSKLITSYYMGTNLIAIFPRSDQMSRNEEVKLCFVPAGQKKFGL